ncbi:MAG: EAL domain-containing protein, partial [Corynebacteriales bacterium]|nr:EAL domain-containing protein [Mycobacteriales bacterium]
LIIGLGRWVLEQACLQGRRWRDEYGDAAPFVSVNIAVRQLRNQYAEPNIVAEVARILATTGLPAHQLQLELTEDAVVHPADDSLTTLEELADMGVRIAIDDFGTGYSNLSYLRRLPVHSLKLDGSFVAGLRSPDKPDPIAGRIIATLVSLAQTLNLNVTAEGIETKEQAALLRAFGCDTGQGYLFSRPMLPEELSSFVSPYPA